MGELEEIIPLSLENISEEEDESSIFTRRYKDRVNLGKHWNRIIDKVLLYTPIPLSPLFFMLDKNRNYIEITQNFKLSSDDKVILLWRLDKKFLIVNLLNDSILFIGKKKKYGKEYTYISRVFSSLFEDELMLFNSEVKKFNLEK